jgi:hypothetical protein
MPSERLPVRSRGGLQTIGAISSESRELILLRLENRQLRQLVIRLSQIVFKNVMERKRLTSDCSPTEPSQPSLCSPSSAPSFWPSS